VITQVTEEQIAFANRQTDRLVAFSEVEAMAERLGTNAAPGSIRSCSTSASSSRKGPSRERRWTPASAEVRAYRRHQ